MAHRRVDICPGAHRLTSSAALWFVVGSAKAKDEVQWRIQDLRSVYTERERARERESGFSSWNSLVICKRTVQIDCERDREHFFVGANDRLDCPQSEFCQKFARLLCY